MKVSRALFVSLAVLLPLAGAQQPPPPPDEIGDRNEREKTDMDDIPLDDPAGVLSYVDILPVDAERLGQCIAASSDGLGRECLPNAEVIALAPHGVLPEHQGEGAGTALVNALLQKAQADGEEVVVVYGWPEYYAKFGFHRASEHGVHVAFARQPEALQVLTLQDGAEVPAGEFRYPPAFGAENAQVAGR